MVSPTQLCWRYHRLPINERYVIFHHLYDGVSIARFTMAMLNTTRCDKCKNCVDLWSVDGVIYRHCGLYPFAIPSITTLKLFFCCRYFNAWQWSDVIMPTKNIILIGLDKCCMLNLSLIYCVILGMSWHWITFHIICSLCWESGNNIS